MTESDGRPHRPGYAAPMDYDQPVLSWRQRLLFSGMALAIVAIVVSRRPASDPTALALALVAPAALPFLIEAVRPRLSGSLWVLAAEVVGVLASVVLLVVHRTAYAEFS